MDALARVAVAEGLPAQQTLEEIVRCVAMVVEFDGVFAGATDPETGLCLGVGLVCDIDERVCHPIWEHEFRVADVNKFSGLTPRRPVGDLREASRGHMTRSPRYRMMAAAVGLGDELRVAFHASGRPWGILQLNRALDGPPFAVADRAFLHRASSLAGVALRRALRETPSLREPDRRPGVVVLDEAGAILQMSASAEAWLEELMQIWPGPAHGDVPPPMRLGALSTLGETGPSAWRSRARTPDGTWLTAHATPLQNGSQVALMLEPTTASEIAPLIMSAHELTRREVEVAHSVARGLSTEEIAARLCVSRHTVRDHLKAIFEKVGVSSRGELTSRLFAEHYHEHFDRALGESFGRIPSLLAGAREE